MRKALVFMLAVLVVGAGVLLASCGNDTTTTTAGTETTAPASTESTAAPSGEPLKIGALLDFTGPIADLGPMFQAGIELALEEAGNQVAGRPIELIVEDSATSVDTAVTKAKKLVEQDGVNIIIGPLMGDAHLALAPYMSQNKVIITSLINGMYDVLKYDPPTYLIYPTTVDAQTYPFGKYSVEKLGHKTAIAVAADYAGKRGYAAGWIQGFKDAGGQVLQEIYPPVGTTDYSPYISKIGEADVVMYALEGPQAVSKFIYQYNQAGKKMPMVTITQDGDYTPAALEQLGDIALGIQGESTYTWQLDNPLNKAFVEAIKAKTGVYPASEEANAYVLTQVILQALESTGGDDTYDALWPAIVGGTYDTVQGPLYWSPDGVAVTTMYVTEAQKMDDGEIVISAPLDEVPDVKDSRVSY
ncbi:MAG: ABC transporter substrate-binding protein [Thermoleophilia bacterium]|nr:ABC transporter substrate-binding protein [Thermoleophilia bacterium]